MELIIKYLAYVQGKLPGGKRRMYLRKSERAGLFIRSVVFSVFWRLSL